MSESNSSDGEATTTKPIPTPEPFTVTTVPTITEEDIEKDVATTSSKDNKELLSSTIKESTTNSAVVEWECVSISSRTTSASRVSSTSQRSSSTKHGEIVILPNGKKVRRVKKSESKKYRISRTAEIEEQQQRSLLGNSSKNEDDSAELRGDIIGRKEDKIITTMTLGAVPEVVPFGINEESESAALSPRLQQVGDDSDNNVSDSKVISPLNNNIQDYGNSEKADNTTATAAIVETMKEVDVGYTSPIASPLKIVEVRTNNDEHHSISQQESNKAIPTTPKPKPIEIPALSPHDHPIILQQEAPMTPDQHHRAVNFPNTDQLSPTKSTTSPRTIESTMQTKKTQISLSLLARTRSRAEVEAISPTPMGRNNDKNKDDRNPLSNASPTGRSDETLFLNPNFAKKRTKVVQLLVFGLLGIVGGFFGSIFVQSTCNFANAIVTVGQYDNSFKVHLGLWKYSPIDSVFQGYSYCWPYDDSYAARGPILARVTGLIALITGSLSLGVLWVYLILGVTNEFFWTGAVKVLIFTGCCQLLTFTFFLDKVCSEASCYFGPGACICLVCTIIWFVIAYEMHNNAPVSALLPFLPAQSIRTDLMNLELPEMHERIKSRWNRLPFKAAQEEVPSLSTFTKKNQCDRYERMVNDSDSCISCISRHNNSGDDDSDSGSYVAPIVDGVV